MSTFPDSPIPSEGYELTDSYSTWESGPYEAGTSVTGSAREFPLASVTIKYSKADAADFNTVVAFYHSMKGKAGRFTFFDFAGHDKSPVGVYWPYLYVGVGDGIEDTFDLPMKSTTSYTVKVAGVTKTAVTHYAFGSGTGADGRDQIVFTAGNIPSIGQIITLEGATGRRAITARFATDSMSLTRFINNLTTSGLSIKEVR